MTTRRAVGDAPATGIRRLARKAGNRGTARLLQRWVDQDGKTYPGDKPADAENWETYDHSGEQRWRPKTAAIPAAATVITPTVPVTAPAAATQGGRAGQEHRGVRRRRQHDRVVDESEDGPLLPEHDQREVHERHARSMPRHAR